MQPHTLTVLQLCEKVISPQKRLSGSYLKPTITSEHGAFNAPKEHIIYRMLLEDKQSTGKLQLKNHFT